MEERVETKSAFSDRKTLEAWLEEQARQGWFVQRFLYTFFGAMLTFYFRRGKPEETRFCLYDLKFEDDKTVFMEKGWTLTAENDITCLFQGDKSCSLPLLDMGRRTLRKFLKSICGLCFLAIVVFGVRLKQPPQRLTLMFWSSLFLFALPTVWDIKSTRRGNNWIRLAKNLILAGVMAALACLLVELMISAVSFT